MANRTSGQVKGDIGEMEVIIMLIRHGMVINSLTQSDAGWDLHAQLPLFPMTEAETRDPKKSWGMSGRTCHIQVKNAQRPALAMRTVRGWVSGVSTGGPPTFLFIKNNQEEWDYVTPQALKQWIAQFAKEPAEAEIRPEATSRAKEKVEPLEKHKYDELEFGTLVHLWSFFPAMSMQSSLDWLLDVIGQGKDEWQEDLEQFALKIAVGLWFHHKPSWEDFESSGSREVWELTRLLLETGISDSEDLHDVNLDAHELITNELHEFISHDRSWQDPGEPSAPYTNARDHADRLEDAIAMVKSIVDLLKACSPRS